MQYSQPALGTYRITLDTRFMVIFYGPGFVSEPRGFGSLQDCRSAYRIVRDDGHYIGIPVDHIKIRSQCGRTVYHGPIR